MKGFNISIDYKLLWELINNDYRIPGWMPIPNDYPGKEDNPIYTIVEIKIGKDGDYLIGYPGQGYAQEFQTEKSFIETCKFWDIKFIIPNKTIFKG
jgi:hypothetical protein